MRYCYAQIDPTGLCVGVLDTHSPIAADHMIPIPSADQSYLGRTWDSGSGTWSD